MSNKSLSVEQVKALYFNDDYLRSSPVRLFRMEIGGERYYYSFENDKVNFYTGTTTFIGHTLQVAPHLIKWIAYMGYDEADQYKILRGHYGTFMHIKYGELLINRKVDLDLLEEDLAKFVNKNKIQNVFIKQWIQELKKDILSFAQWIVDYEVIPLAVEIPLRSVKWGIGGMVDLLCRLTIEIEGDFGAFYKSGPMRGQPKLSKKKTQIIAIVDFKSGKKGFYDGSIIQLDAYERLVKENFPEFKDEQIYIFNFAPSDWRKNPTYKFENQTDKKVRDKFEPLLQLYNMNTRKEGIVMVGGVVDLEENVSRNYKFQTFEQIAIDKEKERQEKLKEDHLLTDKNES